MAFKITGQNIYLRKAQESDMSTLASAIDFSIGSVTPDSNSQKAYWYRENKANGLAVTSALKSDSGYGSMFLTICKKSDDSIVGFHRFVYINQKIDLSFTAIVPSARSNGFYKEVGVLRHKFYYEGLEATESSMKLPGTGHYLDTLYTSTTKSEPIFNQGTWRWSTISASDWSTWINHSNQSTYKSHTYSLTWS